MAWAAERGVRLSGLEARSASLESTFLAIASAPTSTPASPLEGAVR
jgi:ABC-2 type transport system ATP-binding protein